MSDSDEDDVHFCLRCKGTFIGLDIYIQHRKTKCKRDDSEPLTSLDIHFSKAGRGSSSIGGEKTDVPSGSDTSNRNSWTLEGLQNSSPSIREDSRLDDVLQPGLLDMDRKDAIIEDTFLPTHDNDPYLNAADFFSTLRLQSSKNPIFQDISSSQKNQAGMLTRSKASAVIQAKKNKESFGLKPFCSDYDCFSYTSEHSQYVVGKDVIIADDYDYRNEDSANLKSRRIGLDSPKSKKSEERLQEDELKEEYTFDEVHNEVTIVSEVKEHDETDSSSEESEEDEDEEDDDYDTRRISTSGKWKPGGNDWSSGFWDSAPPASYTGGKWKPTPPPSMASSALAAPSTSTALDEVTNEPQTPPYTDDSKGRIPPPGHTRGKWLPSIEPSISTSKSQFWCGPCNRRLSSLCLYQKHCKSDLHLRRTRQENQLEEDLSMENPRALGKREVKRTQTYIDSDLWSRSKRKRLRQVQPSAASKEPRGRGSLHCAVCDCKVFPHLIGKHLVSHFHCLRARRAPELAGMLALSHMESIILQAPFQCGLCKFFCNTMQTFLQHWVSETHKSRDIQVEGRYCCAICRVECGSSSGMYQHLLSDKHKESVAIINASLPIIIQKKLILQCDECQTHFRTNFELRLHSKSTGHHQDKINTSSDKYQERERCPECSFISFSQLSLQRHLLQSHKGGKFFCSCCDLNFASAADAKIHRSTADHKFTALTKQNNEKELTKVCCHCYGVFNGVSELKKHLKEEHPEMAYRCMKCGCHFTLKQELARHARVGCQDLSSLSLPSTSQLSTDSRSLFRCSKCVFTSSTEAETLFHLALHSSPAQQDPVKYQCPSCPRVFLKASLKKHIFSHTRERIYSCGFCESSFTRKDVLEKHILAVHCVKRSGGDSLEEKQIREKNHICEECGAAFFDRSTLRQHWQIHTGKLYLCDAEGCFYAGRSSADLKSHQRIHGEERPFRCNDCQFATKTKAQLVRHGRTHLDTKTHHCIHCDFSCNSSTHLNRHLRVHTGKKPFHCPHCNYSCNLLENLRKHVLSTKKHPGKCLYTCSEQGCTFASNLAREFRAHLVTVHEHTDLAAASFVAGLYSGDDPRHVDQPLAVTKRKKRKAPEKAKGRPEPEAALLELEANAQGLSDNPTLTSAAAPELLGTVIQSEDVICIQLPADDGLDGYDGASFFTHHGDAFSEMGQRALFESLQLHRNRTISLGESAVMMPLETEVLDDHEGLIIIDEGIEEDHPQQ